MIKDLQSRRSRLVALALAATFLSAGSSPALAQLLPAGPPPYIPTPDPLVDAMLSLGSLGPGDILYDLGSGDGRVVIAAAAAGAHAVGVEYEPALVHLSRLLADSAGLADRARFISGDLFAVDISEATLLTLYLSHDFNQRLRPQILERMQPGSRVVSHAFHMGPWPPDSTVTLGESAGRATLFYWMVPSRVDGFWYLKIDGAKGILAEFRQSFQMIEGEVARNGRTLDIEQGRVRGSAISFSTGPSDRDPGYDYEGVLDGGILSGTVRGPKGWGEREWTAVPFSMLPPLIPGLD